MGEISHSKGRAEGADSCTAGGQNTRTDKDYVASI